MDKQYLATYLFEGGVHYEGNERFEYNVPVVVSESMARSLQQVKVIYTSYGPDGQGVPEPKRKFRINNYVPPAVSETVADPVVTDDPPEPVIADEDEETLTTATVTRFRSPAPV